MSAKLGISPRRQLRGRRPALARVALPAQPGLCLRPGASARPPPHPLDLMSGKPGRDGEICLDLSQLGAGVVTADGGVVRAPAGDPAHQADRRWPATAQDYRKPQGRQALITAAASPRSDGRSRCARVRVVVAVPGHRVRLQHCGGGGQLAVAYLYGQLGIGGTSGISSGAPPVISASAAAASSSPKSASDAESSAGFWSPAGAVGVNFSPPRLILRRVRARRRVIGLLSLPGDNPGGSAVISAHAATGSPSRARASRQISSSWPRTYG